MKKYFNLTVIILISCIPALIFMGTKKSASKKTSTRNERSERSEALEALRFQSESRAYPAHDIPADAYGIAYDFYQQHFISNASKATPASSWQTMGPDNVGGRTIGIAVDPNDTSVVWLGSASGGLWKSTTGGTGMNAWTYIPTGFPVLGVSCIAINPSNSQEMYIGTGETYDYGTSVNGLVIRTTRGSNGIGILKSMDGGVTWSQSLNWSYQQLRGIWDIIINPKKTNIVYAATTEGVYKSYDAGTSWTNVLAQQMVMDIEMDKNDTNIIYAGVGNLSSTNKGIYKTSNSGSTWSVLTSGLPANTQQGRISITTYQQNPHIVMALIGNDFNTIGLYRSIDQGATWTAANAVDDVVSYQGWYAHCLMIDANDSSHVFAGGVNLFESITGGSLFNQITGTFTNNVWSDLHGLIANPLDHNKIYLLTDAGLYRSDNLGLTWYDCIDGYNVSQMYIGSVSSTDSTIALAGLQDRNTQRFNGTFYWYPVYGGDGSFNTIDPTDDNLQVASYQYLNIGFSNDQGFNFSPVYSEPASPFGGNPAAFIAPVIISPSDPYILYGGAEGMIISGDNGNTWNSTGPASIDNNNKIITIGISATNPDTVYCATAPENSAMHVFRSIDGANSFTDISAGLPNRYPRDIAVNPVNSREIYVVFSGFGAGHIYKSPDAGITWTDISTTLPDLPFHCIAIDPLHTDTLFAGCDFGIFISTDNGGSWQAYNSGLPEAVMVFDLEYSPSDRSLVAFTFGHGAYKINLNNILLGTNDISQNIYQKIYPNPVRNVLNVDLFTSRNAAASISLFDMNGKKIMQKEIEKLSTGKNNISLNTSHLKNGIYFIKTVTNKKVSTGRFLIEQ